MMFWIKNFVDSPANRTGLLIWLMTVIATVAQAVAAHDVSWPVIVAGAAGGLLKILEPDNTVTQAQLSALTGAVANAKAGGIAPVIADAEAVAAGLKPKP